MSAKVTVIVPIYNVERYVSKCLDSLVTQTFKDIEIFAVDDGSPDNSKDIVKKYAEKDSRVKYIFKKNGGYGSVLEYSIKNINTPYFIICDPDDWLARDAIEKLYTFADKNELDVLVGDKYNVYIENSKTEYIASPPNYMTVIPKHVYTTTKEVQKFAFLAVSPHAKLYRTNLVQNINFPKKVSYTDFLLYMTSLARAKRVAYYNEGLAYYLTNRPGNTLTDHKPSIITAYIKVWNAALKEIIKASQYENVDYLLNRMYVQARLIMSEYAVVSDNLFKDKYIDDIYALIAQLGKYKKQIIRVYSGSQKGKIFALLLFDKITSKKFVRIFIKREYKRQKGIK